MADPPGEHLTQLLLRQRHEQLGAKFAPFGGWDMPLEYAGIVSEHRAVRSDAGIFDVSHLGRVVLDREGATAALRSVTTADVRAMEPGQAQYSLYCNERGGIEDDVFIYRLASERWLVIQNAANHAAGVARLQAAFPAARDITPATVLLAVQGPRALDVLAELLGANVKDLPVREHAELTLDGRPVTVARTGYTGEDGGECIADAETAGKLWDRALAAGVTPAGLGARDTLRLEAALPLHGHDITPDTHPFEAGLGWAVSLDDGADFTGREALVRLKDEPRTRRLAHLQTEGRAVPREGYSVLDSDGVAVGTLTSGTFSPTLGVGIGMAYLPVDLAKRDTVLAIDIRGRAVPATVVRRPFYRRE